MLYLISTPIGNLADLTFRAVETLKNCSVILCEDTRHSKGLMHHYAIETPLQSFHLFNESSSQQRLLERLEAGEEIALISDAGTPLICDPGMQLVKAAAEKGLVATALPGPCAPIVALTLSGFIHERFQFVGFLPKTHTAKQELLIEMLLFNGCSICFESPHRLIETLKLINLLEPNRKICILRELTKKFEERVCDTAQKCLAHFSKEVKGELVLVIEPPTEKTELLAGKSIEQQVEFVKTTFNLSLQEAIKLTAKISTTPRRELYRALLIDPKESNQD